MGFYLSVAIMLFLAWGIRRVARRWRYRWIAGVAIIVFYFKYVISWLVVVEEMKDAFFLDYEVLLLGVFLLGVDLVIDNWWHDDEQK